MTSVYQVQSDVKTAPPGEPTRIEVDSNKVNGITTITLKGQIASDSDPIFRTQQVEDPSSFARSLLIEALERNKVSVNAPLNADNPSEKLPSSEIYVNLKPVALLISPPFSENAKLILKVSQNMQADTLVSLMAAEHGNRSFEDGLKSERPFFQKAGVDLNAVSLGDGRGGVWSDLTAPNATLQLLRYMSNSSNSQVYKEALPILGVDGSLSDVSKSSPAKGNVWAKTGTVVVYDGVNDRPLVLAKTLAGYINSSSGRSLAFAAYVNNVPVNDVNSALQVGNDLGRVAELIYENY